MEPHRAGECLSLPPRLSRSQIACAGFAALLRHRQSSSQAADYKSAVSENRIY